MEATLIKTCTRLQELFLTMDKVPSSNSWKKLTTDNPGFLKSPDFRIAFSYFALLGETFGLPINMRKRRKLNNLKIGIIGTYDLLLQSLAAAGQKDYTRSQGLAGEGVEQLYLYLRGFEPLSSNWSPTLRSEERLVLGAILGVNAEKATSTKDRDTLFDIAQLLNSDKSKLGLAARISRQGLKLDLQREDLRTRDRLRDIRDRLMDDACEHLLRDL